MHTTLNYGTVVENIAGACGHPYLWYRSAGACGHPYLWYRSAGACGHPYRSAGTWLQLTVVVPVVSGTDVECNDLVRGPTSRGTWIHAVL